MPVTLLQHLATLGTASDRPLYAFPVLSNCGRYEEYGTVVPFVLLAPAYFTGALDLGKLMQCLGMGKLNFPALQGWPCYALLENRSQYCWFLFQKAASINMI